MSSKKPSEVANYLNILLYNSLDTLLMAEISDNKDPKWNAMDRLKENFDNLQNELNQLIKDIENKPKEKLKNEPGKRNISS